MGSIVYLGIVIVGSIAGRLYLRYNSKLVTMISLVALEGTLLLFILSDHQWSAYVSRFLAGACQVFLLVYYPVWIDKFGQDKKTLWLTLLQICVPLGIFLGYGITSGVIALGSHVIIPLSSIKLLSIFKWSLLLLLLLLSPSFPRINLILSGSRVSRLSRILWIVFQ